MCRLLCEATSDLCEAASEPEELADGLSPRLPRASTPAPLPVAPSPSGRDEDLGHSFSETDLRGRQLLHVELMHAALDSVMLIGTTPDPPTLVTGPKNWSWPLSWPPSHPHTEYVDACPPVPARIWRSLRQAIRRNGRQKVTLLSATSSSPVAIASRQVWICLLVWIQRPPTRRKVLSHSNGVRLMCLRQAVVCGLVCRRLRLMCLHLMLRNGWKSTHRSLTHAAACSKRGRFPDRRQRLRGHKWTVRILAARRRRSMTCAGGPPFQPIEP